MLFNSLLYKTTWWEKTVNSLKLGLTLSYSILTSKPISYSLNMNLSPSLKGCKIKQNCQHWFAHLTCVVLYSVNGKMSFCINLNAGLLYLQTQYQVLQFLLFLFSEWLDLF